MDKDLSCTFCGKPRAACSCLIAAEKACICPECVVICVETLANELCRLSKLEREEEPSQ